MIDLATLNQQLSAAGCVAAGRVIWRDEVSSTSDVVADLDDYHGAVCIAGLQTAGRGRRGSPWRAPSGSSVLMSMGWRLSSPSAEGLSLVCGLAVREALNALAIEPVTLKWPNDIFLSGRKLGGILVELAGNRCIIGLGLNVDIPTPEDPQYPGETRTPWTDLARAGFRPDREQLITGLIVQMHKFIARFDRMGFPEFREAWQAANHFRAQRVSIDGGEQLVEGVAQGVNERGALIVEVDGALKTFYAGEVSMIPRPDNPEPAGS